MLQTLLSATQDLDQHREREDGLHIEVVNAKFAYFIVIYIVLAKNRNGVSLLSNKTNCVFRVVEYISASRV